MTKIGNIIQGHINEFIRDDDAIEKMAKERLAICQKCKAKVSHPIIGLKCSPKQMIPHVDPFSIELIEHLKALEYKYQIINGVVRVKGCGCRLEAKTRLKNEECPAGKWRAKFD